MLSDHIIAIYHYFFHDPYWLDCAASQYPAVLFQSNGVVSPSQWFIVIFSFLFVSSSWMSEISLWDHQFNCKYFAGQSYYRYLINKFYSREKINYISLSLFCTWPSSDLLRLIILSSDFIPAQWRCITIEIIFWVICSDIIQQYFPSPW